MQESGDISETGRDQAHQTEAQSEEEQLRQCVVVSAVLYQPSHQVNVLVLVLTLAPWCECLIKHSSHSSYLLLYIYISLSLLSTSQYLYRVHRSSLLSTQNTVSKRGFHPQKGPCLFVYEPAVCKVWSQSWEISALQIQTTCPNSQFDQIQTYQICFHRKPSSQSVTPNPLIISINKVYYIFLERDYEHFGDFTELNFNTY